jgi:hypothetical protein
MEERHSFARRRLAGRSSGRAPRPRESFLSSPESARIFESQVRRLPRLLSDPSPSFRSLDDLFWWFAACDGVSNLPFKLISESDISIHLHDLLASGRLPLASVRTVLRILGYVTAVPDAIPGILIDPAFLRFVVAQLPTLELAGPALLLLNQLLPRAGLDLPDVAAAAVSLLGSGEPDVVALSAHLLCVCGFSESLGAVFSLFDAPVANDDWERSWQRSGADVVVNTIFRGLTTAIHNFEGVRAAAFELGLVENCLRFFGRDAVRCLAAIAQIDIGKIVAGNVFLALGEMEVVSPEQEDFELFEMTARLVAACMGDSECFDQMIHGGVIARFSQTAVSAAFDRRLSPFAVLEAGIDAGSSEFVAALVGPGVPESVVESLPAVETEVQLLLLGLLAKVVAMAPDAGEHLRDAGAADVLTDVRDSDSGVGELVDQLLKLIESDDGPPGLRHEY